MKDQRWKHIVVEGKGGESLRNVKVLEAIYRKKKSCLDCNSPLCWSKNVFKEILPAINTGKNL